MSEKLRRVLLLMFSICCLAVCVTVRGDTPPAPSPTVKTVPAPSSALIAGTRSLSDTRTLVLQASEPITITRVIATDLIRVDGAAVFPAGNIASELTPNAPATDLPSFKVTFVLRDVPSGEYSGNLTVVHSKGIQTVPVTVRVKDSWPWAAALLLAGLILSTCLTAYRVTGKLRDQIVVRLGRIRTQMNSDSALQSSGLTFIEVVSNYLTDVQFALDAANWTAADTAMDQAEKVLLKWSEQRPSWLDQLGYQTELRGSLQELMKKKPGVASTYLLTLDRNLADAVRQAPNLDSPASLRSLLDNARTQLTAYTQVQSKINQIRTLIVQLPGTDQKTWDERARNLEQRLDVLTPDSMFLDTLRSETDQALSEIVGLVPATLNLGIAGGVHDLVPSPPPSAPPAPEPPSEKKARNRLMIFTYVSYAAGLALLAGAGFGELYVNKATFGASPVVDYFALVAWGFGAEATRASVMQAVRGWGLPGLGA